MKIKVTENQLKKIIEKNKQTINEGWFEEILSIGKGIFGPLLGLGKDSEDVSYLKDKIDDLFPSDEDKEKLKKTLKKKESEVEVPVSVKQKEEPKKEIKSNVIKNIIIGDSQVPYIDMNTEKASRISEKGGEKSLWEGGKTVSWLTNAVKKYPESPEIENVIISIGTNGGFGKYLSDDIEKLFIHLNDKFPNANFLVVQGSWGWGGLKSITEKEVRDYYKKYKIEGAKIIEPPIGNIEPHGNKPVYKKIGMAIDKLL